MALARQRKVLLGDGKDGGQKQYKGGYIMLRTITPEEMKRVEAQAMALGWVTGEALMQRAAAQVAEAVAGFVPKQSPGVLWVCGTGNNGGDGLAAARILRGRLPGLTSWVWLLEGELSPDAARELRRLEVEAPEVQVRRLPLDAPLPPMPEAVHCMVDALLGTGLSRAVEGIPADLCRMLTRRKREGIPLVSVDIPSGLHGETGAVLGVAVEATCTVTFHRPKLGLYLGQGPDLGGQVRVKDIGLPPSVDDAEGYGVAQREDVPGFFVPRKRVSHKGTYGRVLVLAGSRGMAGAAALCAEAALRTGAGLVTIACPDCIVDTLQQLCPCATCLPLPPEGGDVAWSLLTPALEAADAVAAGCGLGQGVAAQNLMERLVQWLAVTQRPAVLDADGLNLLAALVEAEGLKNNLRLGPMHVLTPHPGEAARLLATTREQVLTDGVAAARAIQARYGASCVVKGATSILVWGQGMALNVLGTPAMAKGGSGDVLCGVLASLLAQAAHGIPPAAGIELLQAGCGLHGTAGVAAAHRYGERGMMATDLCKELGRVARTSRRRPSSRRDESGGCKGFGPSSPLGRLVWVTVDRKLGSSQPQGQPYPVNCGYVQEVLEEKNEWQDAYVLGPTAPVEVFEGEVIARIRSRGMKGERWVVAAPGTRMKAGDIRAATAFGEGGEAVECL